METGDLYLTEDEACDNFDRALYRGITREEYERVLGAAEEWMGREAFFLTLYQEAEAGNEMSRKELTKLLEQGSVPLYQIYTHNCDTAARELIGLIDPEMEAYNRGRVRLTPGGNFKGMCQSFSSTWGILYLGEDGIGEWLLERLAGGW